ncbi:hypothetical protein K1W69_16440 [Hoeflea sp. WL0058]|uniref:Lipoprotein n=1 Tax=Flavimaribacter sediminis TaxID=2865987 RepID=A0AAE2ZM65_9HYPH|nr:hypothetical protein [Flavimaribacter sediminis]MBW8638786.1 hypothetical protein [Flavimaribacter sediminis]
MRTIPTLTIVGVLILALAGCNAGRTLGLSRGPQPPADIPGEQQTLQQAGLVNGNTQTQASGSPIQNSLAALPGRRRGTISFTPVIGAPISAVQPLSSGLGSAARSNGLMIVNAMSGDSDHILKGYFSAFSDGDTTTVAFVWDVLDNNGMRLHRIRGQEVAQGSASDPWSVVSAGVMETIASKTISDYLAWRATARS